MKVETIPTGDLIPYARNAKKHDDSQIAKLAGSIKEFGFNNPVLIDKDNGIIAGHGRIMAAQKLGLENVPCIRLGHLTDTQRRAYILADNRLAEIGGGWDEEMLKLELAELAALDFDISEIGFGAEDLAELEMVEVEGNTDPDEVPEPPTDPVTVLGDVWVLGNHRLMCGDSTSTDAVEKLMDGEKPDMVFTDPPYGINIVSGGKVGGDSLAKTGTYAPVAGDDSIDVAVEAIQLIATLGAKVEIIWGGNYYASSLPNSSCWIVWDKRDAMAGNNFADCELAWTNQGTAVRKFAHTWSGMIKASEHGQKRVHPTQKPVALAAWCFDQYGAECASILDLFGGSGSTLIACEQKSKAGYIMELSPKYCDVIVKRWQDFTGKKAIHESSGKTFDELKA